MSKKLIPTILVVTVLVAGIFAFMPVEQASTVHTSVGVLVVKSGTDVDTSVAAGLVILGTSAVIKQGTVCLSYTEAGADDNPALVLAYDAAAADTQTVIADITGTNCITFGAHGVNLDATTTDATDDLDFVVVWRAAT